MVKLTARPLELPGPMLTLECLINLVGVESHDYRAINNNYRSGHVTEFFEIRQSARILRYVLLLKMCAFLRKILLRLIAEHSAMLGINDDVLHLLSPYVRFAPLVSKR